ncbi:MAG: hypothetical protein H7X77_03460 [Anaerolineae bacterium]|nr:hypothetical protein [Anaerolineae bacterium]
MNTSSNGNPDPASRSLRRGLLPLLLAIIAVGLAVFVGAQVIGVLYSMVFPPAPPRPASLTELSHTSEAYGVDMWAYGTADDACVVARFFITSGGECVFAPTVCDAGFVNNSSMQPGSNVAQCSGVTAFSIFAMRWEAIIAAGYKDGNPTQFKLSREIFWTGEVPPAMFAPTPAS